METDSPRIEPGRNFSAPSPEAPIILVNPAHGNEPFIMGAAFARDASDKLVKAGFERPRIVISHLYGDNQKRILLEENEDDPSMLFLDQEFGNIMRGITYEDGDFGGNLKKIIAHYDEVEALLDQRFSRDSDEFSARSIVDGSEQTFSPKNVIFSIEPAGVVSVQAPLRYFAFPILVSEILSAVKEESLGFSESDLAHVINRMLKVEARYAHAFVPYVNPMSYKYAEDLTAQPEKIGERGVIYTPAMKRVFPEATGKVSDKGVYVMFSGTNSAIEISREVAQVAREAGLAVYSPPWVNVEGAVKAKPDTIPDRNIMAIIARSGWGTGWQAMNQEKPLLATPYAPGDDPEIYFNNKTIEALKIGRALRAEDMTAQRLMEIIESLSIGTATLNQQIKERFGTNDGIDFVSSAIVQDFLSKR